MSGSLGAPPDVGAAVTGGCESAGGVAPSVVRLLLLPAFFTERGSVCREPVLACVVDGPGVVSWWSGSAIPAAPGSAGVPATGWVLSLASIW